MDSSGSEFVEKNFLLCQNLLEEPLDCWLSEAGFVIKKLDSVNTDADSENGESDSELAECQD